MKRNKNPRTQSDLVAAGSIILIAAYAGMSKWLVFAGPVVTSKVLFLQVVAYTLTAFTALLLIRLSSLPMPWASFQGRRWPAFLAITCALAAIIVRFMIKQPPSSWPSHGLQQWRNIVDGYVVGRLLVPCSEEFTFRGLLFGVLETRTTLKPLPVVVITAVIFSALHWPPLYGLSAYGLSALGGEVEVLSALAAGLAFGGLRVWTGSVLPGLGLHMIGNTIGF